MNKSEMHKVPLPKAIKTSIGMFSKLVNYKELGNIPEGTIITLTGPPGSGKTTYALQVLENIKKENPHKKVIVYSYEMFPGHLMVLLDRLKSTLLNDFHFTVEPEFEPGSIVMIDTLDEWANKFNSNPYPTVTEANILREAKEKNCIVFLIHHKTASNKKESGSVHFTRINDIKFEFLPEGDNILLTTRSKNRWPSSIDQINLKHTENGLKILETKGFQDYFRNFITRMKK